MASSPYRLPSAAGSAPLWLSRIRTHVANAPRAQRSDGESPGALWLFGTAPVGGETAAPIVGLGIEVVEIGEAACGEERAAHIADGAFHPALFVATGDGDGPWVAC